MVAKKTAHTEKEVDVVPPTVLIARFIYFVFGVIISFILLRILLLLLAANRGNGFVDFVYDVSGMFVAPFHNMFSYVPTYGSSVFEISSIFAIFVYAIVMWILVSLVTLGSRNAEEV